MKNIDKKQEIEKKFNAMKNEANVWEASWKELATWIRPTRGQFEGDIVNDGSLLDYKNELLNNTPQIAVRTFASGMLSGMTSPARKWFKLEVEDKEINEIEEVKLWLEKVEEILRDIFSKTNVYGALYILYEEIGIFGTAIIILEKDIENVINVRNLTAGQYYLANDEKGKVNTFAREFSMTVAQIVDKFGYENVSVDIKVSYDNNELQIKKTIRQLICPNRNRNINKIDNLNMPFASYYFEKGSDTEKFLRISGYKIFPILAPRWGLTTTADIYGKDSPGWESLGDVKMLQDIEKDEIWGVEQSINPPKLMDDSIEEFDFSPGGVTRFNSLNPNTAGVRNLDISGVDISKIEKKIQNTQNRIGTTWYANLFLMLSSMDDTRKTATEIIQREEEKLLVLAPALERINNEGITPLIDYTFQALLDFDLLEEPPEELQGKNLKIEYISTIAQAQKMIGTKTIEQLIAFAGNIVAVAPDVLDNLDLDEVIKLYGNKLGTSPKIMRSKEAVAAIRDARAKQQQQIQQQEQAMNMVQGAKVLSETEIQDNTALGQLVGE